MKEINYRNRPMRIPQCVEEMSEETYLAYLLLYLNAVEWQLNEREVRLKLLALLLNESVSIDLLPGRTQAEAERFMHLTDPFIKRGEGVFTMRTATTRNLTPGYSPYGDMLHGMTFGQFVDADVLVKLFIREKDPDLLDQLRRTLKMGEAPGGVMNYCAYSTFRAVMDELHTRPVSVNGEEIDFGILFKPDPKAASKPSDLTGWTGVAMEVAENGVFGTYREVLDTSFWDVMLFLYRKKFFKSVSS